MLYNLFCIFFFIEGKIKIKIKKALGMTLGV
jgi:hypothetical protein